MERNFTHAACRKHTGESCPTSEWRAGRTALTVTPTGQLVFARCYDTAEAAAAKVVAEDAWWQRSVDRYEEKQLPKLPQFTDAGRLRHRVWQGGDKPNVDAWGRDVR
jgi:hypothetical protein